MSPRHFYNKNTHPCFVPSNYDETNFGKTEDKLNKIGRRIKSFLIKIVKKQIKLNNFSPVSPWNWAIFMQKKITMSPKNHGNIVSYNEIYMIKLLTSLSKYDRSHMLIFYPSKFDITSHILICAITHITITYINISYLLIFFIQLSTSYPQICL